jgi:DNA-binding transcriptional MerR regulator
MTDPRYRIGELARMTGVSPRTLRFYDEAGLLPPSGRSEAGYRLYGAADVRRLLRIVGLRHLGFGLEEIGALLDDASVDPLDALRTHVARLERELAEAGRLHARLRRALAALEARAEPSVESTADAIEVMIQMQSSLPPEEQARLRELHRETTPERIEEVERAWPELIAAVEREREAGTDPADPRVQELARRWSELVQAFTKGDPQIEAALARRYQEDPQVASRGLLRPETLAYVRRAQEALGG